MPKETFDKANIERDFEKAKSFKELFDLLNSFNSGEEYKQTYKQTYEQAAEIAKHLVETKNKTSWDPAQYYRETMNLRPVLSYAFVDVLVRCITNYNPPVNIPNKQLWGAD